MSEFITIQVGQCGNQIGNCFWKNVIQEYGIQPSHNNLKNQPTVKYPALSESFDSFFYCPEPLPTKQMLAIDDLEKAHVKARAVCIDMEDSVVARFRKGPLRKLFNDSCLLTNYPGSGNNWAEGYFCHGQKYYEDISDRIRNAAECCDALHGFLLLYSLAGGTGSGLGSRILSLLEDQYPHVDRLVTSVYPAGNEDVVTAPYNVALATHELIKNASCVFPVNNQALAEICNSVKLSDLKMRNKNSKYFQDLNNVVVSMLLHLTSGVRFPGSLNVDMNDIAINMVPFPGMHFLTSSVSPPSCIRMKSPPPGSSVRIDEILSGIWSRPNQLIKVDPLSGLILAASVVVRGDSLLFDIRQNIQKLKRKGKFVAWGQDAIKIGICSVPPPGHKLSALGLFNTSSSAAIFKEVSVQFNKLFRRRAHVHHYMKIDGFEMSNFSESVERLQDIVEAYKGLKTHQPVIPPRLRVL